MPELFYRVLHLVGIAMTVLGIGAMIVVARGGAPKGMRRVAAITHGVGLMLVLVAGFGLLAKMDLEFSGTHGAKLGVWFLLGVIVSPILRKPSFGLLAWFLTIGLVGLGGYLVWAKPF